MTTAQATRTVYIETSVVSYLTARPTSNLLAAAWQKATVDWWNSHRHRYRIYTSELTIDEASQGNSEAAARRLEVLRDIPIAPITEAAVGLARALIRGRALPMASQNDALHIGAAAVNNIGYLLTWNFRHLANAETRPIIRRICMQQGFNCPEICSPNELIGELEHER